MTWAYCELCDPEGIPRLKHTAGKLYTNDTWGEGVLAGQIMISGVEKYRCLGQDLKQGSQMRDRLAELRRFKGLLCRCDLLEQ